MALGRLPLGSSNPTALAPDQIDLEHGAVPDPMNCRADAVFTGIAVGGARHTVKRTHEDPDSGAAASKAGQG